MIDFLTHCFLSQIPYLIRPLSLEFKVLLQAYFSTQIGKLAILPGNIAVLIVYLSSYSAIPYQQMPPDDDLGAGPISLSLPFSAYRIMCGGVSAARLN